MSGSAPARSNRPLVAGVDCSTQSTKVLVVDADDGEIVGRGRAEHSVTGSDGARETDPRQWWTALRDALAETGLAGEISALSVAGQQHGLVALDGAGVPLRPAVLWNDTRSAPDTAALVDALGADRWAQLVGSRPVPSFTVTSWAWLRRVEPSVADAARAIRLPHDYLTERLTGRAVTDRGDASGTGWWSTASGAYAPEVLHLRAVRLDPAMLPAVLGPRDVAGTVRPDVAREMGLPDGVLVGPGTGDNMGAALGLGLRVGQAAVSLGTSGTVFTVAERRPADPSGVVAGFADATGRFLPLACTLNCTLAVDEVAGWLGLERDAVEPAAGVVVLPWFDGERTPDVPLAPATITGLRRGATPRQILMATYEGAAASLLDAVGAIEAQVGPLNPVLPLVVVGGGARGATWIDVVRRLSGRPVLVPAAEELVALGAAIQATSVWRGEDPGEVARRWRTADGTLHAATTRDDESLARFRAVRDAALAEATLSGRRA